MIHMGNPKQELVLPNELFTQIDFWRKVLPICEMHSALIGYLLLTIWLLRVKITMETVLVSCMCTLTLDTCGALYRPSSKCPKCYNSLNPRDMHMHRVLCTCLISQHGLTHHHTHWKNALGYPAALRSCILHMGGAVNCHQRWPCFLLQAQLWQQGLCLPYFIALNPPTDGCDNLFHFWSWDIRETQIKQCCILHSVSHQVLKS